METRASYIIVGAFALFTMIGSVLAIVWMAGANLDEDFAYYDIYFKGSVTGLKPGNPVRYRGIPVGVISEMRIDSKNVERVRVTIEIPESTPIKTDTVAALEFQGITGVAYVQISGGTHTSPKLVRKPDEAHPIIPATSSQLEQLFESAPALITRVTALVDRFNLLLDTRNRENLGKMLSNIEVITGALAGRSEDITSLLADAAGTMQKLRVAAGDARETMAVLKGSAGQLTAKADTMMTNVNSLTVDLQKLSGGMTKEIDGVGVEAKAALVEVRTVMKDFGRAARTLAELVEANREPVDVFASSGLYELTQLLTEARVLMGALTRIASQLERDPARFLFGQSQPGVEVR
ncbi:MAG: MlaD family protein [Alphaproteobacteria bacterium]|jgi:phospholipid/cholesterol/gamma-HCH transport system substrate-binding protein